MKKGFSNFMTSIDSALKPNTSDDISDTVSIQSDMSSDSENFMMVLGDDKTADCMDALFRYDSKGLRIYYIEILRNVFLVFLDLIHSQMTIVMQ